jgi:hypothetical protein
MRTPSVPHEPDAILAMAVELVAPPEGHVEAFRAELMTRIAVARRHHQDTANLPPPGEMKALAVAYSKVLKKTKKAANAVRPFSRSDDFDDFVAALDREILRVDMEARDCLVVPAGAQQRDTTADVVAIMARNLIDPNPAIDCPWRTPAKLTYEGAWLRLAALIYEGATGEARPRHDESLSRGR